MDDPRDAIILVLAERLYTCSHLLTCAAERLGWDNMVVQDLVRKLEGTIEGDRHASIEKGGTAAATASTTSGADQIGPK